MDDRIEKSLRVGAGLLLLGVVAVFVIFAVPQLIGASHSYAVLSDSMSPAIQAGDGVIVDDVDASTIGRGDIITYRRGASGNLVTHRVVNITNQDGVMYFRTKGDANEDPDPNLVAQGDIVGQVVVHIPYIGHVTTAVRSDIGLVGFVILPILLFVLNEVWEWLVREESVTTQGGED